MITSQATCMKVAGQGQVMPDHFDALNMSADALGLPSGHQRRELAARSERISSPCVHIRALATATTIPTWPAVVARAVEQRAKNRLLRIWRAFYSLPYERDVPCDARRAAETSRHSYNRTLSRFEHDYERAQHWREWSSVRISPPALLHPAGGVGVDR
jgi:hypothetical protein